MNLHLENTIDRIARNYGTNPADIRATAEEIRNVVRPCVPHDQLDDAVAQVLDGLCVDIRPNAARVKRLAEQMAKIAAEANTCKRCGLLLTHPDTRDASILCWCPDE